MTDQVDSNADPAVREGEFDPRAESEAEVAATGEPRESEDIVETLQRQLAEAQQEASAAHERFLRTRADMENFKKRMERTYADRAESSKKQLLSKLLGVKDNLERALHYGEQSQGGEGIIEGVRLTQYQLDNLLQGEGVARLEAEGKPFDPRTEEAIQSVDDPNVPDGTVVQVVRKGYTYGDDVLRPAQVIVSVHGQNGE